MIQININFRRTLIIVCALLTYSLPLFGQDRPENLMSNPSIDSIEKCTENQYYISAGHLNIGWWSWLPYLRQYPLSTGTVYLNTCHDELMTGVLTSVGHQARFQPIQPKTGAGYSFFASRIDDSVPDNNFNIPPSKDTLFRRQYLKNHLRQPLERGNTYLFLFYQHGVQWNKNNISRGVYHLCASKALGVYFSVDSNSVNSTVTTREMLSSIEPQIQWDNYELDTTQWQLMAGCFTANGGERFMTLGRFNQESVADLEDCRNFLVLDGDTIFTKNQTERMFVDDFGLYDLSAFTFPNQEHCLKDTFFFQDPYNLGFIATYDGDTLNQGWVPPGPGTYSINIRIGLCDLEKTFKLKVTPCSACLPNIPPIELCPNDSYFNPSNYIDPILQVEDTIIPLCPGIYEFPVFHPHCSTPVDILKIEVVDYPKCHNQLPLDIQCVGTELQLPEGDQYHLDVGGTYIPAVWTEPGEIPYQLFDDFCDIEVESGTMRVIECEDCDIFIPNVFSPNGDGINDYFEISTACHVRSVQIQIFDRYGAMVRESRQLQRIWDGGQQRTGVYAYRAQIEHTVANGTQTRIFAGTLTLTR